MSDKKSKVVFEIGEGSGEFSCKMIVTELSGGVSLIDLEFSIPPKAEASFIKYAGQGKAKTVQEAVNIFKSNMLRKLQETK